MRISKTKPVILLASFALLLPSSSAIAADYPFPTGMTVSVELGDVPLFRSGSNVVYPIQSHFSVNFPNGDAAFVLTRADGTDLTVVPDSDRFMVLEPIAIGEKVNFLSGESSDVKPVRVLLDGPLAIGHLHFMPGSAKLSDAAKYVLDQTATQMRAAGLFGAYLVGSSDRAGSRKSNLMLSERRVIKAASYLRAALGGLDIVDPIIQTEFMGEYLSQDKNGSRNILDRKVSILLFPKL